MARIIKCDICGKEIAHNNMDSYLDIPDSASTLRIKAKTEEPNSYGEAVYKPDFTYEICQYCTQRVMDFVKNLTKESRFGDTGDTHGVSY